MLKSQAAEIKNEPNMSGTTGASSSDSHAAPATLAGTTWEKDHEHGEKYVLKIVWVPFNDDGSSGCWIEAWIKESHLQQAHGLGDGDEWIDETDLDEEEGDRPRTSNQVAKSPRATETMDTSEINAKQPAATPEPEEGVHLDEHTNGEGQGDDIQLDEKGSVTTKRDDEGVETNGESEGKTPCEGAEHDDENAQPVKPEPQKRFRQKRPAGDLKAGLHEVSWVPLTETGFRDFIHACQHGHTVSESQEHQRVAAVNTEPKPTESVIWQPARGCGTFQEFFRCQAPDQNPEDLMTLEKLIKDCSSMDYVDPALLVEKGDPPHVAETMAYIYRLRVEWGVTEPTDVLWWLKHM